MSLDKATLDKIKNLKIEYQKKIKHLNLLFQRVARFSDYKINNLVKEFNTEITNQDAYRAIFSYTHDSWIFAFANNRALRKIALSYNLTAEQCDELYEMVNIHKQKIGALIRDRDIMLETIHDRIKDAHEDWYEELDDIKEDYYYYENSFVKS